MTPLSFREYVTGIRFRSIQPETPVKWPPATGLGMTRELGNLELPCQDLETKRLLRTLDTIPRMSTFANAAIIHYGVKCMAEHSCYVNIGTWCGFSLFAGMLGNPDKYCIGVDNFSQFEDPVLQENFEARFGQQRSPCHQFFQSDYQEYFRRYHTQPIGFYFYDGNHTYTDQKKALKLAEPFFADDCVIMVDDTNWPAPRNATLDFIQQSQHKYTILLDKPVNGTTGHPTFWNGLMILQKS